MLDIPYSPVMAVATTPVTDAASGNRKLSISTQPQNHDGHGNNSSLPTTVAPVAAFVHAKDPEDEEEEEAAGHDSPNWSKVKSFTILFACTLLYSIIAEILVDTVDHVMVNLAVDEKFLGLTLFALVRVNALNLNLWTCIKLVAVN